MTNGELKSFANLLCKDLRLKPSGGVCIVKESGRDSDIRELHLGFKNKDDALVLRQDTCKVYPFRDVPPSCDFIAVVNKGENPLVCFCEMKTTVDHSTEQEAAEQIEASELFFDYLHKSYIYKKGDAQALGQPRFLRILFYKNGRSNKRISVKSRMGSLSNPLTTYRLDMDKDKNGKETKIAKIKNAYDFFMKMN